MDRNNAVPSSSNRDAISRLPLPPSNAWKKGRDKESQLSKMYNPSSMLNSMNVDKDLVPVKHVPPSGEDVQPLMALSHPRADTINDGELLSDVEEFNIPWNDLVLKERIGAGNLSLLVSSHLDSGRMFVFPIEGCMLYWYSIVP